ncbi:MAG: alanine racemase, partial [Mycobacteriaceae bacterium]|nr:alanine racemase [Mycobacteriaceae bacterium]
MTSAREAQLTESLALVRARLKEAATAVGRNPSEIELLPVTKFFPATDVAILAGLGCQSFGESREQEAAAKAAEVATLVNKPVRWHMVGNIQRNKTRSIARWADAVHSVSSTKIVDALSRHVVAAIGHRERGEPLRVFVQISLDGDVSRGGVDIARPDQIDDICARVADTDSLQLAGVMGIPPLEWDADDAFAQLAAEHRRVLRAHPEAVQMSAGMSADLEIA